MVMDDGGSGSGSRMRMWVRMMVSCVVWIHLEGDTTTRPILKESHDITAVAYTV